ncbi:metal-sulfur cluster assembly factor [Rhizosaccharibacter radicis]|uniref:Iron-sulfur cluster assembly protein n=1 Tax=Rhizosaccharibacter radicis TaxID=2782605 RepID=A0ABT1W131_9PROT|nr:iron-sulfur cluster assembly protein [Acetobacteraceae bacterium KSS12]
MASLADPRAEPRLEQLRERLHAVTDPELDESVLSLGFVSSLSVDDRDHVAIGFRLPTYWCSANFAWIMAEDMRDAVRALPWVKGVSVSLDDHMFAAEINGAMAADRSFRDAFGAEADGSSLEAVRRTFERKAFGRRQLALAEALLADGWVASRLTSLRVRELSALAAHAEAVRHYLAKRAVPGPFGPDDPALVDEHNRTVAPERLAVHLSGLRGVVVNMEFNGALCRGLLAARYDEQDTVAPLAPRAPELIDFIRAAPRPSGGTTCKR